MMFGRKIFVTVGILCGILAAPTLAAAQSSPLRRLAKIKVKSGYIDAHFAVSPNGRYLGYVHVGEADSPTHLIIMSIRGRRPQRLAKVDITKKTVAPVKLAFTPDSKRLMVMVEMSQITLKPPKRAWFFERNGRLAGKIDGFSHLAFRKGGKSTQIVAYLKKSAGQRVTHQVTLYNAQNLRRKKTARLISDRAGKVKKPSMEIAYWMPDFTAVVVKVAGKYDRKRDIRLPDREKLYDPFAKKFTRDVEIANLAEWTKLRKIRAKAEGIETLLRLTGSQKKFIFEMITPDHRRVKLADTQPPLKQFQFESLVQQETYAPTVPFSLTVDPQWPTLFGDKRNVPEVFHLFVLDPTTKRIKTLGSIPSPKQVLGWHLGGRRLAVMRLHRYWRLGHRELEIYKVPPLK
jgi:hypothetical protein